MGKTLRKNITWRLTWKLSPDFKCVPSYCKPQVSLPHLPKWTTVLFIKIRHLLWKVCSTFQKSWKGWQPFPHFCWDQTRSIFYWPLHIWKKKRKLTQQELLFHSLFWKTLRQTEWLRRCQRHLEMMANVLKGNKCNFHGQVVERPGTFKYIAISKGTLVAQQNMNEGSFDAQKWTDLCHHCRSRAHGDISSSSYSSRPNLP